MENNGSKCVNYCDSDVEVVYKKDYVINGKNDIIAYLNAYLYKKIKVL